jgi:plasmid stabilization system protein ParE
MTYEVLITEWARQELDAAADWIAQDAPRAAQRWFNGFAARILLVRESPHRCALAVKARNSRKNFVNSCMAGGETIVPYSRSVPTRSWF